MVRESGEQCVEWWWEVGSGLKVHIHMNIHIYMRAWP